MVARQYANAGEPLDGKFSRIPYGSRLYGIYAGASCPSVFRHLYNWDRCRLLALSVVWALQSLFHRRRQLQHLRRWPHLCSY